VQTADQPDIDATGEVPGTFSVFDLHPTDTKFYIGGVPENSGVSTSDISLNSCAKQRNIKISQLNN